MSRSSLAFFDKTREGELGGRGGFSRGGAYFKFWLMRGTLIRRGRLLEGRRKFEDLRCLGFEVIRKIVTKKVFVMDFPHLQEEALYKGLFAL